MNADRNLLFGILALQMDFVTRDQLVAAMNAWVLDKKQPLAQILLKQGALSAEVHKLLEALVAQHLKQHGGDVERSLAAIAAPKPIHDELSMIGDSELAMSMMHLAQPQAPSDHDIYATQITDPVAAALGAKARFGRDRFATQGPSVGSSSSAGLRFRILRPHAKGGLGEVFVARDEELRREVALKHMQSQHADNPDSRSRFMLEAEITGSLEHPGIVPVYGLGTYDDGRPFYAMRFIRGDSLKDAIDRFHKNPPQNSGDRALEMRKLLARMIDVCNAIEYAHSRGVVHRDLKPGNVMLGKYGETLVVDWGLAKAMGQTGVSVTPATVTDEGSFTPTLGTGSSPTLAGSALGTPQYMSPEQAAGRLDMLGPQSDVYSLGATLYCLLTGRAPMSDGTHDIGAMLRRVQRGDIAPPRSIKPDIPRPLEAICLKAMAVEVGRRYTSARALADDLEHWLANEPVSAWRETLAERAARWARRHRTWIKAGVTAVLAITAISVVFSSLLYQARNRAEESFLQARATVDQYFTDVSENRLLDVPTLQPLREDLLKSALAYYEGFVDQRGDDPSVRAELGKTYYRIGRIEGQVRSKPRARESLEQARLIQEELAAGGSASAELRSDLAETYNAIGDVELQIGNDQEALAQFEAARKLRAQLVDESPEDGQLGRKLGNSYGNIGITLARLGDASKAETHYQRANTIREKLARQHPKNTQFGRDLASGYYNFGVYQRANGKLKEALDQFGRAAGAYEKLAALEPAKTDFQRELAMTRRVIGEVHVELGDYEAAQNSYDEARELGEQLARRNPFLLYLHADVAATYTSVGQLQQKLHQFAEALQAFEQARSILERLTEEDATVTRYQHDLAAAELQLGIAQLERENLAQSLAHLQSGLKIYQTLAEQNRDDLSLQDGIAEAHLNIGLVQRASEEHAEAVQSFQQQASIYEKLAKASPAPENVFGLADALLNVAVEQRALEQVDDALVTLEKARGIQADLVRDHPAVPKYRLAETEIDYLIGRLRFERAQRGMVESADSAKWREDLDVALATYRRVRDQRERLLKDVSDDPYYQNLLGVALDELAVVLWQMEAKEESLKTSRLATEYLRKTFDNSPQLLDYKTNLASHYRNRSYLEREAGNLSDAARLAMDWRKISSGSAAALYEVAVALASTAAASKDGSEGPKTDRSAWLDQAVEIMAEAVKAGLDTNKLQDDPALKPLHEHAGFQALLQADG
ncbi:MAG: protein kinase [Pirellulales bacterium]